MKKEDVMAHTLFNAAGGLFALITGTSFSFIYGDFFGGFAGMFIGAAFLAVLIIIKMEDKE